MAFSPFNFFRRNQKAIFAVVTVFIMFTFVLSSGLGGGADFFDWLPRMIGASTQRGDHLCTIDGRRVYAKDLDVVRADRTLANKFMFYVNSVATSQALRAAQDKVVEAKQQVGTFGRAVLKGDIRALQFLQQMVAINPKGMAQERQLVLLLESWVALEGHRQKSMASEGLYFFNAPNKSTRDVVNFMLWERKAEQLGIVFADEDIDQLIYREGMGMLESLLPVQQQMAEEFRGRFTATAVRRALAAEFRVRAAQAAILGPNVEGTIDRSANFPPIFPTPFDVFTFYQDKASPAAYQVLAVPAASFADKMTAAPTEPEVARLFQERKDYEPDPSKEEPGFKEPRRVKVEWVGASGEEPYYKKAAVDWVARAGQLGTGGPSALIAPLPGVGPAGWAAAALGLPAGPANGADLLIAGDYQKRVAAHKSELINKWGSPAPLAYPDQFLATSHSLWTNRAPRAPEDNAKKRPVYAAGPELAAQLTALGAAGIGGGVTVQPVAFFAQALAHEARDRGTAGAAVLMAGVPGPGLLAQVAGGEAAFRTALPPPPPVAALKGELLAELTERKTRDLALADLKKLQAELVRLSDNGKAKDKGAAAREFAAAFIKERGLKTGATPTAVSEWSIRDDAALAPLRDTFLKTGGGLDPHTGVMGAVPFGLKFFYGQDPVRGTRTTSTGVYVPEFYPERAAQFPGRESVYLAWRTEDTPARPQTLAEARPQVVAAWRRQKARDEAKAAADRLADRVRALPSAAPVLVVPAMFDLQADLQKEFPDQKAKDRVKLFELKNVAPIQVVNELMSVARPFFLTPSADLPYPTPAMEKELLEKRTSPAKTAFVIADAPKDTYYVFVSLGRQERGVDEFRRHMYLSQDRGNQVPTVQTVVTILHRDEVEKAARASVLGLLKKEFRYEETEAQTPKLDDRERRAGD